MIYCDSRHAELETCCDIPSGPVSRDSARGVGGWVLDFLPVTPWGGGVQGLGAESGHLPSECSLGGSLVVITRGSSSRLGGAWVGGADSSGLSQQPRGPSSGW